MRRFSFSISRFSVVLSTVVVIIVGFLTFLGLLLGDVTGSTDLPLIGDFLSGDNFVIPTEGLALIFVQVAIITIAMTILVGFINLLVVNVFRMYSSLREQRYLVVLNSFVIIVTYIATIILYVLSPEQSDFLLEDVQVPIEAALASLLFFALVYGGFRILRNRVTFPRILFVLSVLVVLVSALPLAVLDPMQPFTDWVLTVPVNAGASGILLGIALATVVAGLRILIGQDRTYGE